MASVDDAWRVLPHQPIEKLDDRVWRVQGSLPGMPLRRVMTIARSDDGLVLFSPIALEEAAMREIEAWGEPRTMVVPNGYHRLDAPAYRRRYPHIRVLCPAAAVARVGRVVAVDGTLRDFPEDPAVSVFHVEGLGEAEAAMVVRGDSGTTLVLNDAVFNQPHGHGPAGWFFRHVTQSTGGPTVSRVVRWFLMRDREAFRGHLRRLAELEGLRRVIVAHHRTIDDEPAQVLRRLADAL